MALGAATVGSTVHTLRLWYQSGKGRAAFAILHKLRASFIEHFVEAIEAPTSERGDGLGRFIEAVDDAEAEDAGAEDDEEAEEELELPSPSLSLLSSLAPKTPP